MEGELSWNSHLIWSCFLFIPAWCYCSSPLPLSECGKGQGFPPIAPLGSFILSLFKDLTSPTSFEDLLMAILGFTSPGLLSSVPCCCHPVAQSCLTLCNPMDCSSAGFPVLHHLLELAQTHAHWVGDALLVLPSVFPSISSSHQVVKVLELQFQHQSFQWIFRTDFF